MKQFLTSLLILFGLISFGQDAAQPEEIRANGIDPEEIEAYLNKKKVGFNLELGTTFGFSGYGNYFGTYIAPRITYNLTKRFTIGGGAMITGYTPLSSQEQPTVYHPFYGNRYGSTLLFLEGAYQVNENLRVTGMVYKEVNPFKGDQVLSRGYTNELKGMIMGVDYKIGENAMIRGQIEISNGYRNPFYNPYRTGFQDPFFRRW